MTNSSNNWPSLTPSITRSRLTSWPRPVARAMKVSWVVLVAGGKPFHSSMLEDCLLLIAYDWSHQNNQQIPMMIMLCSYQRCWFLPSLLISFDSCSSRAMTVSLSSWILLSLSFSFYSYLMAFLSSLPYDLIDILSRLLPVYRFTFKKVSSLFMALS